MSDQQDHIDFKTVDEVFGTNLNDLPKTINEIQSEISQIAPAIQFVRNYWPPIVIILFLIMVLASFIGSKIAK